MNRPRFSLLYAFFDQRFSIFSIEKARHNSPCIHSSFQNNSWTHRRLLSSIRLLFPCLIDVWQPCLAPTMTHDDESTPHCSLFGLPWRKRYINKHCSHTPFPSYPLNTSENPRLVLIFLTLGWSTLTSSQCLQSFTFTHSFSSPQRLLMAAPFPSDRHAT